MSGNRGCYYPKKNLKHLDHGCRVNHGGQKNKKKGWYTGNVKEKIKETPKGFLSGCRKTVMTRMENNLQGG
jgi:hypothetical protein